MVRDQSIREVRKQDSPQFRPPSTKGIFPGVPLSISATMQKILPPKCNAVIEHYSLASSGIRTSDPPVNVRIVQYPNSATARISFLRI